MQWTWRNISDPVFDHAIARPAAPAMAQGGVTLSYAQLAELISQVAVYLHEIGVQPDEVVGVALPGGIDHAVLTLALLRVGAVPLDLSAAAAEPRIDPVRQFAIGRVFLPAGATPLEGVQCHLFDADWRNAVQARHGDRRVARDPDAMHFLYLASGPAAAPKAVVVTQRQLLARLKATARLLPDIFTPERPARLLLAGGKGFAGFALLAAQLGIGGSVEFLASDLRANRLAQVLAEAGDAVCLVGAAVCRQLLAAAPEAGPAFPRLRGLLYGAGVLSAEEKRAVALRLTANGYEIYGTPAGGFLTALRPATQDAEADTVGRRDPGGWAEAVDGGGRVVPAGVVGHLRFRGPGVALELYKQTPAQSAAEGLRDGWHYPGDIGTVDDAGFIRLRGGRRDLVRRGGADIVLPELEALLRAHDAVTDAAVVDVVPAGGREPLVIGFVEAPAGTDGAAVQAYLRAHVPAARTPDRLVLVAAFPRGRDGKADRRRLVAAASGTIGKT